MDTQLDQVRKELVKQGRITSWEAIQKFRITRLSAYINMLREMGMDIHSQWKQNAEGKRWVEYQHVTGHNDEVYVN